MTATRRTATATALLLATLWPARASLAYVNPNFTPQDVYRQYSLIALATVAPFKADDKAVTLTLTEVLKGQPASRKLTLDLSRARAAKDGPAAIEQAMPLLASGNGPVLVFLPGPDAHLPNLLIHADGSWLRAATSDDPAVFHFEKLDTWLNGTFNGGTDMLADTMRFIGKFPGSPIMPVDAGVKWDVHRHVGKLPGAKAGDGGPRVTVLKALDVDGDGKRDLFVASAAGDRIFLARDKQFEAMAGLESASLAADWADFDGDGSADMASLTAAGLTLYLNKGAGRFEKRTVELPAKVTAENPTLTAADLDGDGRADLVVGATALPVVLHNEGQGKFAAVALKPAGKDFEQSAGPPGPCAVADFDGDGRLDIVQCLTKDGLLFRGQADGQLSAGQPCGAAMGPVRARRACVADLAGNSQPGLLLAGGGRKPLLYLYRDGRFVDVWRFLGEPSYIVQAGAASLALGDFNNDGFVDLFVCYDDESAQCFFNRGQRSMAICESLKLPADDLPGADKGQSAALWTDLDGDGSLDLVTVLADGEVYVSMTNLGAMSDPRAIAAKLDAKSGFAGPLAVTFFAEGYCLGARYVSAGCEPALMGVTRAGEYTVKWRLPGRGEQERKVTVVDGLETVVIGPPAPSR